MLKYFKFMIIIIFLICNNRQILLNASRNTFLKLIKPLHYLIDLRIHPQENNYNGSVNITYVALKPFHLLVIDGILKDFSVPGYTNELSPYSNNKYHSIRITKKHVANKTYSFFIKFSNNVNNNESYGIYRDEYFDGNETRYASNIFISFI